MSESPALEAVADGLFAVGRQRGWWPKGTPANWRELEPKARGEFLALAEQMLETQLRKSG